ncbi:MAG: choice-of-anchor D domain-containing protein [Prosthecobacter sp.]
MAELLSRPHDLSDPGKRAELVRQLKEAEDAELRAAHEKARQLGLPIEGDMPGGGKFVLVGFDGDTPRYQQSENVNAAISTAANLVRSTAPYNVNGAGWTFGLWEAGGIPLLTHQEFGVPTKVTVRDGSTIPTDHATHVGATLAGLGINAPLLGMAPAALIDAYSATNDISEMMSAGAAYAGEPGKLYVSNHSYGYRLGWYGYYWYGSFVDDGDPSNDVDTYFGRYNSSTASTDGMLFNLPYLLSFQSSGNSRDDGPPAAGGSWSTSSGTYTYDPAQHPAGNGVYKLGYDTMDYTKVAKNIMTVGAANDAVSGGVRNITAGSISYFSSTGPADDGRIKPDIVANGVSLLSAASWSDTATTTMSGTSMSSPNAAGSAMLLADLYGRRFPGEKMRASTLKALIIHTADDIGNPGPDYFYGWGYMNAKAAADHILRQAENPGYNGVIEAAVSTAEPADTYSFTWNGSDPVRVTLCWTDPAGTSVNAHDDRARDLVNDLNLSVSGPGGTTHLPFVMPYVGDWSPAKLNANATTGVNTVDNVEQVFLPTPPAPGLYTITVNHAGPLTGGQQAYSLIISGQTTDALAVAPGDGFTASGQRGGPFSPASKAYTLTNTGNTSLSWTAASSQGWIALAPTSGSLEVGESTTVTATLTSAADALPGGSHGASLSFANVGSGATATRGATLNVDRTFLSFNFDTNPGWSTEGQWAFGVPGGMDGDPASAKTGTNVYGYNLNGEYPDSMPVHALTTTALDCTGKENVNLGFWRWLGVEDSWYDHATVQVSRDGINWTTVWDHVGGSFTDTAWTYVEYNISAIADDQPVVYVRWLMGPTDSSVTYPGWNIDDVALLGDPVPPRPEIAVHNGPNTSAPQLMDEQDAAVDFGIAAIGSTITRHFTIANTGTLALAISGIAVPADFTVLNVPSSIAPGASATFQIRYEATLSGSEVGGSVVISSNDSNEASFDFPVKGAVNQPEIAVDLGSTPILDGQAKAVEYLTTAAGVSVTRSFTISNPGIMALTVSSISAPAGYTVLGAPSSVGPGSTATFQVRLNAALAGVYSGSVVISSNDLDEASFDFPVRGTVLPAAVQPGAVDTAFGTAGRAVENLNFGYSRFNAVAVQPDGKTLAAGWLYNGSNDDFLTVRFNADGSLDSTFGGTGIVITPIGGGAETIQDLLVQPDGKIVVAGTSSNDFAVVRYNSDGTLDTTFDGDGKVVTPVLSNSDVGRDVILQPDGKIIVVGSTNNGSNDDFAVVRYNSDGSLDTSFDTDGKMTAAIGTGADAAESIAIQPNGALIIAGSSSNDFAVARFTSSGAFDTTFDTDGKIVFPMGSTDIAYDVKLQVDGKIVVTGNTNMGFGLARLNSNGSLDTTFDGDGKVITVVTSGTSGQAFSLHLLADGKMLVAGYGSSAGTTDFALLRYNANGSLDTSFGPSGTGMSMVPINTGTDWAFGLAVHASGRIVLSGSSSELAREDASIAMFNADGTLYTGFDGDGKVLLSLGATLDVGYALALKPSGEMVLAGYSYAGRSEDFAAMQLKPDGSLDNTFGNQGKFIHSASSSGERSYAIALQGDGKIVLGGHISSNGNDFQVMRLNTAGLLDTSFDTDGIVSTQIGTGGEVGRALSVQPDGKIVLAGYSNNGTNDDFALVRYLSTGALDTSFDSDGKLVTPIGTGADQAFAAMQQGDGKMLVAGSAAMTNTDFAIVRYKADGSLDTTFDTDGKATFTVGTGTDVAYGIGLQRSGKIILGGDASNDFGLIRLNVNGSLDSTFGINGRAVTPVGTSTDTCYAIAIQPDDKIVAVGRTHNGTNYDMAVLRYTAEGRLDATFGTAGKIVVAPGSGDDYAMTVALKSDGGIVVGGYTYQGANAELIVLRFVGDSLQPEMVVFDGDSTLAPALKGGQAAVVDFGAVAVGSSVTRDFTLANNGGADLVISSITVPAGYTALNTPAYVSAGGSVTFQVRLDAAMAGFFSGNVVVSSNDAGQGAFDFPVRGGVGSPEIAVTAEGVAVLDAQPLPVSFRATPQGMAVTRSFVIENNGHAPLNVTAMTPPAGFSVQNAPASVAAGATASFQITLLATAAGSFSGDVVISSNDADEGGFRLPVAGSVVPGAVFAGQLDPAFGTGGIALTGAGTATDQAFAVVALRGGKTLIGGDIYSGGDYDFHLMQVNADGTLDTSFGTGGVVVTRIGTSSDRIYSLALQSDGKILAAGYSYNGVDYDFALVRHHPNGTLDTTFDGDGIVTTPVGTDDEYALRVLLQPDGKIVLTGQTLGTNWDFAAVRYTSAGALDTTFGAGGKVVTQIGTGDDIAYGAALQADGKIVLGGGAVMANEDFAVVRYLANGTLDPSFGTGGKVTTVIGTGVDRAYEVMVQPDGKILLGGYMAGNDFAMVRHNSDGTLDTTFGTGGKVAMPIGTAGDVGYAYALLPDGKILAAGYSAVTGNNNDVSVARFTAAGALDTGFDGDGKTFWAVTPGNFSDVGRAIAVHADGSIAIAGYTSNDGLENDSVLLMLEANGSGRAGFGNAGVAIFSRGASVDYGLAMIIQPDQKVVAAGYAFQGVNDNVLGARFLPGGAPDTSYGSGGRTITRVGGDTDRAYTVAVQPDGKLVFGGYSNISNDDFMLMRQNADGTPDTSFGSNGSVTTSIGAATDQGRAVLLQGDGRIVLAGYANSGVNDDFALVRYDADGSLDGTFGVDGKVTTVGAAGADRIYAISAYPGGRILVGGEMRNTANTSVDFGLARYNANGTLDTSFGTNGVVLTSPVSNSEYVYSLLVLPDGRILAAGEANGDAILVRLLPNGTYDTSFGTAGKSVVQVLSSTDTIYGIALQPDGKIVATGRTYNGSNYDLLVLRFLASGQLDSSFGTNGKIIMPYGTGDDYGRAIALQNDGAIVITGYTASPGQDIQMLALRLLPDSLAPEIAVLDMAPDPDRTLVSGQPGVIDFGAVASGSPVSRAFLLKNTGPADLTVSSITTPAGFSVLNAPAVVPVGGQAAFQIRLDAASAGIFSGTVVVHNNDADEAAFSFPVRGSVDAPEIVVSLDGGAIVDGQPTTVAYRTTSVGAPIMRTFTVSNQGFSALSVAGISAPPGFTLFNVPTSIPSGASRAFQLRLDATANGYYAGTVTIQSNDSDEASFDFPVAGTVSGVVPAPGVPDVSFGTTGSVSHGVAAGQDQYHGLVQQPDGKLVAAGRCYTGGRTGTEVLVTRHLLDGTPDATFGEGGRAIVDLYGYGEIANSLVLQPDGKIIVVGAVSNGSNDDFFAIRLLPDGTLDSTFSGDGKIGVPIGSGTDVCLDVALQSDGKILLGGYYSNGSNDDIAVVRLTAAGVLDTTFDTDGKVTTAIGTATDRAYSVAVQTDGNILVGGYAAMANNDFALVRYSTTGALDTSFGTGGKVTTAFGTGSDVGWEVAVQADGKIVLGGYANMGATGDDFALARYDTGGVLDATFDGDGRTSSHFGTTTDQCYRFDIQPDGKIVTTGIAWNGSNYDLALARHTAAGAADTTFGTNGRATFGIGTSYDYGRAVKVLADGRLAVAGYVGTPLDDDPVLLVTSATGVLDATFGGTGVLQTENSVSWDVAYAMQVLPDDRIWMAGYGTAGFSSDFQLSRFLPNGTPDTTVTPDGITRVPVGTSTDYAYAFALQPDGKTLLAGMAYVSNYEFGLIRLNVDGTLDTSFATAGKSILPIGSGDDIARAVLVQPDGKILVAGYSNTGGSDDFAVVRYLPEGVLDASFGTHGIVTTPIGSGTDRAFAAALQPDGKILLGGYSYGGGYEDFALVRYNSNGTLDSSFGTGGKVTTAVTSDSDVAYAMLLQPDGRILLGGYGYTSSSYDFALVRYQGNGALDTTFGTNGRVLTAITANSDYVYALGRQADGRILATGRAYNGVNVDIATTRYLPNGTLDPTFGSGGVAIANPSTGDAYGYGIGTQSDGSIIVGGWGYHGSNGQNILLRYTPDALAPEITLYDGTNISGAELTDSQAAPVDFGITTQGVPVSRGFTVHNTGTADLLLGSITPPLGFTLETALPAVSLPPSATHTFQVRLDAASSAQVSGNLALLNNGTDPSFEVPLIGLVVADPAYAGWATSAGLGAFNGAAGANPSHDGLSNLLKYAFNLNPSAPDLRVLSPGVGIAGLPHGAVSRSGGDAFFRLEFLRRTSGGLLYTPQKSAALSGWSPVTTPPVVTPAAPGWERVVIEEPVGSGNGSKMFLRVQVSQP